MSHYNTYMNHNTFANREPSRILFIRYKAKEHIPEGGSIVTEANLRAIRAVVGETSVDEYAVHDSSHKISVWGKMMAVFYFLKNLHYGLTPRRLKEITHLGMKYDVVFIDRSIFGIIAKRLKENGYKGRIICFFHNFEPLYFDDKIRKQLPFRSIIIDSARRNEEMACKYSDSIIALNKRDGDCIVNAYNREVDALIPVSFKNNYSLNEEQKLRRFDNPPLCLFFGAYFTANNEGLLWFVKEVLPHVNIRLQIIGKGMENLRSQLPKDNKIELLGSVPDLKEYMENADLMILPIFKGSGMKVKTCECMMYGKYIIGSSETFEGYDVDYNLVGALANTKEEYIAAIEHYSNGQYCKYNDYSRRYFVNNHTIESTISKFERLLGNIGSH